jgi:hypothetical protein
MTIGTRFAAGGCAHIPSARREHAVVRAAVRASAGRRVPNMAVCASEVAVCASEVARGVGEEEKRRAWPTQSPHSSSAMFNTPTRARPVRSERSSEAPMDFEYTDRPAVTPSWAPRKHALDDAPGAPPAFGAGTNVPFIFHTPMPEPAPWAPPQGFSPAQAFPDVDMAEPEDGTRALALGGMKRVYRRRRREARARDASDGSSTEEDDDDDRDDRRRLARRTPHRVEKHYTLNMSAGDAPRSELPVLLLGWVGLHPMASAAEHCA